MQAVIHVEGRNPKTGELDPKVVSNKGAMGLTQLMPENVRKFRVKDPFDPYENVHAGSKLLHMEFDKYKEAKIALAAYNGGDGAIELAKARARVAGSDPHTFEGIKRFLPKEAREYPDRVQAALHNLR